MSAKVVKGKSVVLLYHRLGFPKLSSLVAGQYVAPRLFSSQLMYFKSRKWQSPTLSNIIEGYKSAEDLSNSYLVTFDDGYLSVYEHGFPLIKGAEANAVVYIVTSCIGGINEWDRKAGDREEQMMTVDQIRELADAGIEIGSHTLTHPHLTQVDDKQLNVEIADSKKRLEDIIGREVKSFSYPYGDYDNRVVDAVRKAGYSNAVTTKLGIISNDTDPMRIPRINIRWNTIGPLLNRKIWRACRNAGKR